LKEAEKRIDEQLTKFAPHTYGGSMMKCVRRHWYDINGVVALIMTEQVILLTIRRKDSWLKHIKNLQNESSKKESKSFSEKQVRPKSSQRCIHQ
jgi:hypothetical protein